MIYSHLFRRAALLVLTAALIGAMACGDDPDPTATSEPAGGGDPTATSEPGGDATATSEPTGGGDVPDPDNPAGTIEVAVFDVAPGVGMPSSQAPVESMQYWNVGDGLFYATNEDPRTGKLAETWEVASDFSYVDIDIRQGVQFHNHRGDFGELTAEDIAWTLNDSNATTNPGSIHGQAGDFAALFGEAEVLDDYKVRIPFVEFDIRWDAHFLNEAAQSTAFFSKAAFDQNGVDWMRENIVSTGPFQVAEWIENDHATLEKVPYDHWWRDAQIETLRFIEVPEESSRVAMLSTGEVDISADVPFKDIPGLTDTGFVADSIAERGTIHSIIWSGNLWEKTHARTGEELERGTYAADFAWIGDPDDEADMEEAKNVRTAMSMAIDRNLLIDAVLDGFGVPASTEYVDVEADYYQDRWDNEYNADMATQLMETSEWPDGAFTVGIWTGGELAGTNGQINDAVAAMWLNLWPQMDLQVFKSAYAIIRPGLVARTNTIPYAGDCDEGATTIPFDWPHGLTETSLTRGGFGCGIEIPQIAETYLQVASEPDIAERMRLNTELVDFLQEQQLITGTVQVPNLTLYNPKSIESWEGYPGIFPSSNGYVNIVPASR
ncbi:MAG: ABC transporter substrate-binding protein [Dehalococcoidia bacterium]